MKTYLAILLLLLPAPSLADNRCMETAISDPEIIKCASQQLDRAETALSTTYKATLAKLDRLVSDGDEGAMDAKKHLIIAQEKWEAFRQSDCDVVFFVNVHGSIRIPETIKCMADHAAQRNEQLQQIFD